MIALDERIAAGMRAQLTSRREKLRAGDVIYTPRGHWHGFDNTGEEDVLLIWGWSGAGSLEAAGYELP